ncbi:4-alpha-glucanotransferase [Pseudoalteromonas sp. MMG010]|uniref:4-alpha-glucanotransferase n=1 Tax=Pseudoalteromonas sp. MMG010 TaxID=2822685 RepID=UPI001B3A6EA0|nr:4-alpha-glucanotransferase [Pseudoalteromonas sp. MMG010]MBQ4833447.1 4-alpha-glucanotransferase [Pseudoalteromonas sp. MMG010]
MNALSQLFYLSGVGYEYTKYTGEHVYFSEQTRKHALSCCEINAEDDESIARQNYELDAATWLKFVPDVSLVDEAQPKLKIRIDERQITCPCKIYIKSVNVEHNLASLIGLYQSGEYILDGIKYIELLIPLPHLPVGYHAAEVLIDGGHSNTQIWVVPEQVFQDAEEKRLGLSLQLYTLKNKAGLGIGDFSDLLDLIDHCAKHNMDYILLNPLHLLFADNPDNASPYSPNSRALLNPLYINIAACVESENNPELNQLLQSSDITSLTQTSSQFIDYKKVSDIKYRLFSALYNQFSCCATNQRRAQFNLYCEENKMALATIKSQNREFDYYLQWQAHCQLVACQARCKEHAMAIGLINDLAVGCSPDGCEYSNQQPLFAINASVGAPPDPWAEGGQNWGLPALNPHKLKHDNYAFFKSLIRANMQGVGGLRIDHVMALRRLWWCFDTLNGQDGCYMYYPFEHLLAILKIESNLNKCIVIGEDLGVVPPEVKNALKHGGIFSNSLFYFEKDEYGEFLNLNDFDSHSLLMIANHDVPPFAGWWHDHDINIKCDYALLNEIEKQQQVENRLFEKERLLRFIKNHTNCELSLHSNAMTVYEELAKCLAKSKSRLFALQLDDLDEQHYPVNIPGTHTEYPNWRRVLNHSCDTIFSKHASFLAQIDSLRNMK